MSVLNILYSIFIMPLQLFFEVVFVLANRFVHNPGLSIIVLSLAMNFLVLPLYRRADAMQEEERDIEAKLHNGVKHIKKTFKGDERMMILNTYYRQNGYKPTYVFRGAISLFLEIPFFIAAYQFLSHLELLQGVSFGPLHNLGAADHLLMIGGIQINLLPIIMTAVNLVSCVIFTKGYPMKTKIQLYAMAIFFFFFLYGSPSGLVFYWTLNNIFSLVKTIFYKLKNPKQMLLRLFAIVGLVVLGGSIYLAQFYNRTRILIVVAVGIMLMLPEGIAVLVRRGILPCNHRKQSVYNSKIFIFEMFYMVFLIGFLIPTTVISSSPQEFVDVFFYNNPLWYIANCFFLAVGMFLVWFGVFYWLADASMRFVFEKYIWLICGIAVLDYMFFGKKLGILSSTLKYENSMMFSKKEILVNLGIILVCVVVFLFVYKYAKKYIFQVLLICTIAFAGMSIGNIFHIQKSITKLMVAVEREQNSKPEFTLSKNGNNVIVFMLDRAMNEFVPYIMNEKPELMEMFSGFTYYENTLSFGGYTNFATPALFGGYEYTPDKLNARDTESLQSKQNEALKVMPVVFDESGYDVTVCDPSYANYQWIPDTSIYDDYPDIDAYVTRGKFPNDEGKAFVITCNRRNFFCYSIMKTLPVCIQSIVYDDGKYNNSQELSYTGGQTIENNCVAKGTTAKFIDAYTVLQNLSDMTKIQTGNDNTFLMITNDTTHEPMLLQEPDYVPASYVDNRKYETGARYAEDGQELHLETSMQCAHYQVNMSALLQIGQWLNYLKANDVYDNTRIIIVSDHGRNIDLMDNMIFGDEDICDAEFYYPLLMVKDFNSKEFTTSDEFMTNADVPTLAMKNVINDASNPFTGQKIDNADKYLHDQYVFGSNDFDVEKNNGNQFLPGTWFSVHDDVREKANWTILQSDAVSPMGK